MSYKRNPFLNILEAREIYKEKHGIKKQTVLQFIDFSYRCNAICNIIYFIDRHQYRFIWIDFYDKLPHRSTSNFNTQMFLRYIHKMSRDKWLLTRMCIENLEISYKIIQILIINFDNSNTFMCEIYENQVIQFYSY